MLQAQRHMHALHTEQRAFQHLNGLEKKLYIWITIICVKPIPPEALGLGKHICHSYNYHFSAVTCPQTQEYHPLPGIGAKYSRLGQLGLEEDNLKMSCVC